MSECPLRPTDGGDGEGARSDGPTCGGDAILIVGVNGEGGSRSDGPPWRGDAILIVGVKGEGGADRSSENVGIGEGAGEGRGVEVEGPMSSSSRSELLINRSLPFFCEPLGPT